MSAVGNRSNKIRSVAERFRRDAPDAKPSAIMLAAEVDVAAAHLFHQIAQGQPTRDLLTAYNRLLELRINVMARLHVVGPLPRGRISDDDPENDPDVRAFAERVQQEQRDRLREVGVIKD